MAPEKTEQKASQKTMLHYFPKSEGPKSNWRLGLKDLSSIRNKARKNGLFTDVQFVMGEGDQRKEFHAHKAILASASPVFESMFYGPMAEKDIIETDDDPEAFDMLLDYIYFDGTDSETKQSLIAACKFFMIGDKYLVHKIERIAKVSIRDMYRNNNDFWGVIQENNLIVLCPIFRDQLNFYIMENTEEFFVSFNWLTAPETIVQDILQMDKLNIEEYSLLEAVTKWAYHNKKPVTPKILMQYYKHIRFSLLSSFHLMRFIEAYPKALEAEAYLAILRHAHLKSGRNLPEWCSTSKVCRKDEYTQYHYGTLWDAAWE